MNRHSRWSKLMPFAVYLAGMRVKVRGNSFYIWTITYIESGNEKNEHKSLMNMFAHFKDIDSQCTQDTIHDKLFLLIINQFHCYYYQGDHYIVRSIERVVMNFFKKLFYTRMKGTTSFLFLHIASLFFFLKDAMCKGSKHAVLFCFSQECWWLLLCI